MYGITPGYWIFIKLQVFKATVLLFHIQKHKCVATGINERINTKGFFFMLGLIRELTGILMSFASNI